MLGKQVFDTYTNMHVSPAGAIEPFESRVSANDQRQIRLSGTSKIYALPFKNKNIYSLLNLYNNSL